MNFYRFAETHGLIIKDLIMDRWVRVPTIDHPTKRNGAYIFQGSRGAVQNWALHEKPIVWRDKDAKHDPQLHIRVKKAVEDQSVRQDKAAKKAAWILNNATKSTHPYLATKGFPDEKGYVFDGKLVIPMRIDGHLVGCQMIDSDGKKKFLYGQKTKGATATFDNKGSLILCEGYATALSIRRTLKKSMTRYCIHVCFSAGNLIEVANRFPECVIVADNDPVGVRSAKKTGKPYWVSPNIGEDFNDYEIRISPSLDKSLLKLIAR
jgi:putative DNA primase/helicase